MTLWPLAANLISPPTGTRLQKLFRFSVAASAGKDWFSATVQYATPQESTHIRLVGQLVNLHQIFIHTTFLKILSDTTPWPRLTSHHHHESVNWHSRQNLTRLSML